MLKELVQTMMKEDVIHLVIYCVRGERVIRTLRRNYKFIHSQVKGKVPIVLVITSLESYEPDMEEWWRLNENAISKLGMIFAGHACVTTGMITHSKVTQLGRNQSYDAVCKLIEQCRLSKPRNVILFGQRGAGKSSLVNLIAGENVAKTSSTLQWREYSVRFDGDSYNVYDTVGLEEAQLGTKEYLDAIENAYSLIQGLEKQGGIDLLLFCMRAGRPNATIQSNYRLFHEFLCDKKVPVVVVITYLENEVGEMDTWWTRNKHIFRHQEFDIAGHACITAIKGNDPHRYEQSRTTIRSVVKEFTADGQKEAWKGGDNTFVSLLRRLGGLLGKPSSKNDMVFRLIKRCELSSDVAKQVAGMIKNDLDCVSSLPIYRHNVFYSSCTYSKIISSVRWFVLNVITQMRRM
ncbi:P-loop containing nucleoside triphosphate hydrolase protein [Suillus occidentalis]|nr:P-loop containing nucleoside triphosphate hydrolase protein [Suillus occidentalis]